MPQLAPPFLTLLWLLSCPAAVVASPVAVTDLGAPPDEHRYPSFDFFVKLHNRPYRPDSAEYAQRRDLYEQRVATARLHNARPAASRRWTAGISDLSDRTEMELASLRGWRHSARQGGDSAPLLAAAAAPMAAAGSFLGHRATATAAANATNSTLALADLPREKLWTNLGAANNVYMQGACGSCWAIAAATVLQAHAEIHTGSNRTFSAQQLVSCVPNPQQCGGPGGCLGATLELAMDWVMDHGCATEDEVPYGGDDGTCTKTSESSSAGGFLSASTMGGDSGNGAASFGMHGWETLPQNLYAPLMRAVHEKGPVGVAVAAGDLWFYSEGVFDGCGKDAIINHAVVLLGYGEDSQRGKYWLLQNSWGTFWGESGTFRLLRRDDDDSAWCGINNQPELGVGCTGGPPQVTVCGMCGILYDSVVPHFG